MSLTPDLLSLEHIGERVRIGREKRGHTIATLSIVAGVAPATIRAIENGRRDASVRTIAKLSRALGVSPTWIVTGNRDPQIADADVARIDAWIHYLIALRAMEGGRFAAVHEAASWISYDTHRRMRLDRLGPRRKADR